MKPLFRAIVPLILLLALLSLLWRGNTPLPQRLPYGTRTIIALNDPLKRVRKVLGSRLFRTWEADAPEGLPRELVRRLENPSLPVALLLGGVRQAYWITGGVPEGDGYREFRLAALDVAFLRAISPALARLPGVTREGAAYRWGDQRIAIDGDMLFVGDEFAIQVLADVSAKRRERAAAKNEFGKMLFRHLSADADLSAVFLSPKPIFDGLGLLDQMVDLSTVFDRQAFGGAALHVNLDEQGLRAEGLAINRPEQGFLRACIPTEGGFAIPAALRVPPYRYLGMRVDRADRLGNMVASGIFHANPERDRNMRTILGAIFVRAFLSNFGGESGFWIGQEKAVGPVIVLQVKDRAETDRYLTQLRTLLRQDLVPDAEPDALVISPVRVYYRVADDFFLLALARSDIDRFLESYRADARASGGPLFGIRDIRAEGCVVGYGDVSKTLGEPGPLARFAPLAPRVGLSVRPDGGLTRFSARVAFDDPIRPIKARAYIVARALYLGIAALYVLALVTLAALSAVGILRFVRARKAAPPQEDQ